MLCDKNEADDFQPFFLVGCCLLVVKVFMLVAFLQTTSDVFATSNCGSLLPFILLIDSHQVTVRKGVVCFLYVYAIAARKPGEL